LSLRSGITRPQSGRSRRVERNVIQAAQWRPAGARKRAQSRHCWPGDSYAAWSILHRQALQLRVDYICGEIAPSSLR
jgi:hypothetical protein